MTKVQIRFIVTLIALIASIGLVVLVMFLKDLPYAEFIFTSIGVILGWAGTAVTFYLGSSQSSDDKNPTNIE